MLIEPQIWLSRPAYQWLLVLMICSGCLGASEPKQQAPFEIADYLSGSPNESSPQLSALTDYIDDLSEPRALWRRNVAYDEPSAASLDYDLYRSPSALDSQPELGVALDSGSFGQTAALQRRFYSAGEPASSSSPVVSLTAAAAATQQSKLTSYPSETSDQTNQQQQQQQQQQKSGPYFIKEPPSFIHYLNSSDLVIPCVASGNPTPTISWWHKGAELEAGSLLDRRYIRYDNALVISAFEAHEYEPEIHATTYKCLASNSLGTISSRDVLISAAIDQDYEVNVADQFVSVDNDALFRCQIAPGARDFLQVVGWLDDQQHLIAPIQPASLLASTRIGQKKASSARALLLPDGQLYVARVQPRDANKSYRCQVKNLLNSRLSVSSLSGRLYVTEANGEQGANLGTAPRILDGPKPTTLVQRSMLDQPSLLACLAQGSPRPTMRWFTKSASPTSDWIEIGIEGVEMGAFRYSLAAESNLLLISQLHQASSSSNSALANAQELHGSKFKCLANNTFGTHALETELRVELWPADKLVEINEPRQKLVSSSELKRQSVQFNCTVRASVWPLLALDWLKNGRPLYTLGLRQFALANQDSPPIVHPYLSGNSMAANSNLSQIESMLNEPEQQLLSAVYYDAQEQPDEQQELVERPASLLQPEVGQAANFVLSSTSLAAFMSAGEQVQPARRVSQRLRQLAGGSLSYQLRIEHVRRSDRGAYQCRARTSHASVHSTAHLMLKDNPPQFVDTFASQLISASSGHYQPGEPGELGQQARAQPAQHVSLRCVASGSPLPEISWTLSGFQVPESSRFRVGDYVTRDGLIVSFVNISQVQAEDGGLYECSASNDVGQLKHSAWLNVSGPPQVRPMGNLGAIAGRSLAIMCPVGGWPVDQITWFQNSTKLPANHRQRVFANGSLLISELSELTDSGQYSCQARSSSNDHLVAVNHVQVSIKVPPLLEPFSFAKSLHRGQRYNIMCTVVRGDLPVSIRWLKDGRLISGEPGSQQQVHFQAELTGTRSLRNAHHGDNQATTGNLVAEHDEFAGRQQADLIAIKQLDPYSSTLTFSSLQAEHRGLYTCEASNEAGRANQSSLLVIHVPPEWRIEPKDLSVTVGRTAVIDCQADAFPAARIEWRLSQDSFREPPAEFKPIISSLYMRVFENGSLIIYNSQRSDAGYYLCQASNGVGPGISRVIKLTTHVSAHFKSKIRTELVRRTQTAKLRCEAIGDPPIEVNWLRDKVPLYGLDEPRYSFAETPLADGVLSELTIVDTDRPDSALFTCISQNSFGNDDTNIQLVVQSVPDPPLDIRIHEYESRSVKISWLPGHSGNSPVQRYTLMYGQLAPGGHSSLSNISLAGNESTTVLQNLTPLTEYQFYLQAANALGASRLPNEPVKFRTDDEAPASPPLYVKVQAESSRSIRVRWRAPERRAHFGSISGFYVGYKLAVGPPTSGASVVGQQSAASEPATFIYKTVELQPAGEQNRSETQADQECLLSGLRRAHRYLITVQAFNGRGAGPASEPVMAETWRFDVPDPPSLRLVMRTRRSVHLAWHSPSSGSSSGGAPGESAALLRRAGAGVRVFNAGESLLSSSQSVESSQRSNSGQPDSGQPAVAASGNLTEPIVGYVLTRRQLPDGQSMEVRLPSDHLSQIVDNLACGTRYEFTIAALNSIGLSPPSEPLLVKTEGSEPVAPDRNSLLSLNSSSVLINLAAWHNGACTMRSFDVAFKPSKSKKWNSLTSYHLAQQPTGSDTAGQAALQASQSGSVQRLSVTNSTIVLDDLSSALNYDLKIVATNEAGSTEALYTFNTHSVGPNYPWLGGSTSPDDENAGLGVLFGAQTAAMPYLVFLIIAGLFSSVICLALVRARSRAGKERNTSSSSACSLSLSSASRSNQSGASHYYATSSDPSSSSGAQKQRVNLTSKQLASDSCSPENELNLSSATSEALAHLNAGIYGNHHYQQHQQLHHSHHLGMLEKNPSQHQAESNNYSYLARASSPTELASEAEMCLGASALSISGMPGSIETSEQLEKPSGYFLASSTMAKHAQPQHQLNHVTKSSTLPANCHAQQLLHQLIQQHQAEQHANEQQQQQQQVLDAIQHQQQATSDPSSAYLLACSSVAAAMQAASEEQQASLMQQQQQAYATVKRGCPRPPRLCDYTIYQCPNVAATLQHYEANQQLQMDANVARCCEVAQQQSGSDVTPEAGGAQQAATMYSAPQQQPQVSSQQQSASDYQQLRLPLNQ